MKARKSEKPTSSWLVSTLIVISLLGMSYSPIQANQVTTVDTIAIDTTFDKQLNENDLNTFDKRMDTFQKASESSRRANELAKAELLAGQIKAQRDAQLAEEAKRLAEEARYSEYGLSLIGSSFRKTYMDYRVISSSSTQMQIINSQTSIQDNGLLMTSDGFIGVALGSRFGSLGNKFRITTDTGAVFKVIKVDEKSDMHTTNGTHDSSGAIIEFVIDTPKVQAATPSVTFEGSFHVLSQFSGNIVKIEIYR